LQHADGTLAALVVERRDPDDRSQWGNQIVEIDEDGDITELWSTWDCFDPDSEPGDDTTGWTYANALDYSATDDAYYVGLRNFSSIVKVSRETGECDWVVGSVAATFEFADGSEPFYHQHQFQVRGTGNDERTLLVFDNEGSADGARVIEYKLDLMTNVATQEQVFESDPNVESFVLGEPTRLGNDTFVSWGAAGQLERFDADGESTWKLTAELGNAFGFYDLADSLYPAAQE
jgi:hypothetical protein